MPIEMSIEMPIEMPIENDRSRRGTSGERRGSKLIDLGGSNDERLDRRRDLGP